MRLRPIFERLKRAGVRNVQVLPAGDRAALGQARRQDGPGADRCALHRVRRLAAAPDAKWRLSPQMLEARLAEQRAVLDDGREAGQAGRPARLHHLLGAACREPRPGRRLPRAPVRSSSSCPGPVSGSRLCPDRRLSPRPTAATDTLLMTPLEPRHRRLLRRGAGAGALSRASPPVCGGPAARAKKVVARRCCDLKLINRSLK